MFIAVFMLGCMALIAFMAFRWEPAQPGGWSLTRFIVWLSSRYPIWSATKSISLSSRARDSDGVFLSDFEQSEIGPDLFRKACEFGFEGLVSKRRDRPYQSGRPKHWIKVKNRRHPAMERVAESFR